MMMSTAMVGEMAAMMVVRSHGAALVRRKVAQGWSQLVIRESRTGQRTGVRMWDRNH